MKIKFSHKYFKMPKSFDNSFLLDVWIQNIEDMSKEFLHHDTHHSKGWYKLPKKGKYLVLFIRSGKTMWATLRRWTPKKEKYYKGLIGRAIEIEITKGE